MELEIEDAKFFKQCIDAVVNLVDEGSFEVSDKGLHLRMMDPSQIALVDFSLPREAFKKLEVDGSLSLGVNLADLSKVLSRSRSSEALTLALEEKESNKLFLEFRGESTRSFKLPLLDLSASVPREPKIPFESTVQLKGGSFKEMLKDASLLSSHVSLEVSADKFVVEAHGDAGDLHVETRKDAPIMVDLKSSAKSRAMFPFEYLSDITQACPDDAVLSLEMKNDSPVRVSYQIGKARLAYFLAPRVESA